MAVFDLKKGVLLTNLTVTVADAPNGSADPQLHPPRGILGARRQVRGGGARRRERDQGGTSGQTVTGSPTWDLVLSSTPLLACDASGNNCIPATSAIPTTREGSGGSARSAGRPGQAARGPSGQLQADPRWRPGQLPGLKRTDIALVCTFTITSQAEVTFDPANSVIPFPNDILNRPPGRWTVGCTSRCLPTPARSPSSTLARTPWTGSRPPRPSSARTGTARARSSAAGSTRRPSGSASTGTMNLVAAGPGSRRAAHHRRTVWSGARLSQLSPAS